VRLRVIGFSLAAAALIVATAEAQRRWYSGPAREPDVPEVKYDGQVTFARLKFTTGPGGYYFRGLPAWAHGYPRSERNLVKILKSVTSIDIHTDLSKVVAVGDPELFKYPLVYASEPGFLEMSDTEAAALRAYLQKGGFIIFDDFRGGHDWENFVDVMQRVLPGERPVQLDVTHPIFHAFFEIETLNFVQFYDRGQVGFYGMFEDNDPKKPLQLIANFNNDVSEYWEYSDTGYTPIDLSNEAYKFGVNYFVYGMTH